MGRFATDSLALNFPLTCPAAAGTVRTIGPIPAVFSLAQTPQRFSEVSPSR